jgi:hypothetical protein
MAAPSPSALLALWEQCLPLSPVARAVALLEFAKPAVPATALPLGSLDRELLRLRAVTFGGELTGLASCPRCGETVEVATDADTIIGAVPDNPAEALELTVEQGGYRIRFRLPTSEDLLVLDAVPADPERVLLARCLRWADHSGSPVPAAELPDDIVDAIGASMSEHDPLADIELACSCPGCGYGWAAPLDVPAFLWAEIADLATRVLYEVHVLASGYGWREADILALSPARRHAYLELMAG